MKQIELDFINDMQIQAEASIDVLQTLANRTLAEESAIEYNQGMIDMCNNIKSFCNNLEFRKNYEWYTTRSK